MSQHEEELEEPVELDWPDLQDTNQVARFVFGRKTGRPTIDETEFRAYYQQQILFPELLRRAGIGLTAGGSSVRLDESSPQRPKKTRPGLVEKLLGSFGEPIQEGLEQSLGVGLGGSIATAGGVIAALLGLWEVEKRVEDFPPFLHIIATLLRTITDILFVGAAWLDKDKELELLKLIIPSEILKLLKTENVDALGPRPPDLTDEELQYLTPDQRDRAVIARQRDQEEWDRQREDASIKDLKKFLNPKALFTAGVNPIGGLFYSLAALKKVGILKGWE